MDINSDNDSKDNHIDSMSHRNNNITNGSSDIPSYHIYSLSPIECFFINKHLSFPFKLELEDVYKAYLCKKQKQNEMISTYNSCNTFNNNNISVNNINHSVNNTNNTMDNNNNTITMKRKTRRKRKRKKELDIDNESFDLSDSSHTDNYYYHYAHKKFPPLNRKITKKAKLSNQLKCERVIYKLQRLPISKYFFTSCSVDNYMISRNMLPKKRATKSRKAIYNSSTNTSSDSTFHYLKKIYMKVQNKEYHTLYHFGNDLRRTWDGLLRLYANNPKLYTKIYRLSEKCEEWINRIEGVSYGKLKKDNELSSEDELCELRSNNSCYKEANAVSNGCIFNAPIVSDNHLHNKFITHNVGAAAHVALQQQLLCNNKLQSFSNSNMLFQTTTYQQQQHASINTTLPNSERARQQRFPGHAVAVIKPPTREEKDFIHKGIDHLSKEQKYDILKIIDENAKQNKMDRYVFNIEDLEVSKQRELYNYVSRCLAMNQQRSVNNINTNTSNIHRDANAFAHTHERRSTERERSSDFDKVEQLKKDLDFHSRKYSTVIDNTCNLPKYNAYINNANNSSSYF